MHVVGFWEEARVTRRDEKNKNRFHTENSRNQGVKVSSTGQKFPSIIKGHNYDKLLDFYKIQFRTLQKQNGTKEQKQLNRKVKVS